MPQASKCVYNTTSYPALRWQWEEGEWAFGSMEAGSYVGAGPEGWSLKAQLAARDVGHTVDKGRDALNRMGWA